MQMKSLIKPVIGLVMAGAVSVNSAQAKDCLSPSEEAAFQTRVIQSDLMVGALACNSKEFYNAFVVKFEEDLVEHGTALRRYFEKRYGAASSKRLNAYITQMANDASRRSMRKAGNYCESITGLFQNLMEMDPEHFGLFVSQQPQTKTHGMTSCQAQASLKSGKSK